jgi:hypothetical protein
MFSSKVTKEVKTPSTPSYTVTIKALSGRAKERCQQATIGKAAEMMQSVGGAAIFEQIRQMGGEQAVKDQVEERDPKAAFDREQTLIDGVVKWSAKPPVTPDTLNDLEADTADFLFVEILRLSKIPISEDDIAKQDVDRKNG